MAIATNSENLVRNLVLVINAEVYVVQAILHLDLIDKNRKTILSHPKIFLYKYFPISWNCPSFWKSYLWFWQSDCCLQVFLHLYEKTLSSYVTTCHVKRKTSQKEVMTQKKIKILRIKFLKKSAAHRTTSPANNFWWLRSSLDKQCFQNIR